MVKVRACACVVKQVFCDTVMTLFFVDALLPKYRKTFRLQVYDVCVVSVDTCWRGCVVKKVFCDTFMTFGFR